MKGNSDTILERDLRYAWSGEFFFFLILVSRIPLISFDNFVIKQPIYSIHRKRYIFKNFFLKTKTFILFKFKFNLCTQTQSLKKIIKIFNLPADGEIKTMSSAYGGT